MVRLAKLDQYDTILEPSAGQGAIIKAINKVCDCVPDCYELMDVNRTILNDTGLSFNLIGDDFFGHNNRREYSKIIANPPFTKNQDIDHIKHMYSFLKDDGKLVSVASTSWQHGSHKKQVAFREWLDEVGAEVTELPAGTFKESGTNIATVIVEINK